MVSTKMNMDYIHFGGDEEILLMSIIYKMQIILIQNDSKGLILETDTEKLYSVFESPILPLIPPFLLLSNESILHKYVQPLHSFGSWR